VREFLIQVRDYLSAKPWVDKLRVKKPGADLQSLLDDVYRTAAPGVGEEVIDDEILYFLRKTAM
jgi:hypothetical protein